MTLAYQAGASRDNDRATRVSLGEIGAPLYVIAWFVVQFEPFALLVPLPGSAASLLLPVLGVCVLCVAPARGVRRIPVSVPLVGLVLWMACSFLWTESLEFTFLLLRNELPALGLLWLLVGTMRPNVAAATLTCIFAGVGVWSLVTSLTLPMSSASVQGIGPEGLQEGWRGTFGHKNILGIFVVLGIGLLLAFEERPRWRPRLVLALVVVCVGTRSATAASGLAVIAVVHFWLTAIGRVRKARDRAFLRLLAIASVVAAGLLVVGILPLLVGVYGKDLTFSGRTEIWAATLEAIDDHPIRGYGIGGIWFNADSETTQALHGAIGFGASHAHNGALNLWLESGIVGLVLYILLVGRTLRLAARCLSAPRAAPYGRWAITTIVALLLMSLSEPLFRGPGLGVLVITWTVVARVANDQQRGRPIEQVEGAVPWWRLETVDSPG